MTEREHDVPEEILGVERRLDELGEAERRRGARVAHRVAMRTAHLLREPGEQRVPLVRRLRAGLVWLAAPAGLGVALLIVVAILNPGPAHERGVPGVEVLAANVGRDIDAWAELDSMWHGDSFETDLAVLSLEAADFAAEPDDLNPIPTLDAGS